MTLSPRFAAAVAVAVAVAGSALAVPIEAHFRLLSPAPMLVDTERGDPQKAAPCGTAPDAKPTGVIGTATGGSTFRLKVHETIYHPGHYRVALAVNSPDELPPDPVTTERMSPRGPVSVWAVIQSPPQAPVIADGLFQHYSRPAPPATGAPAQPLMFEADVPLPNINCPKCILQVVQFMAEHSYNQPGGYSYHHCAELAITADPAKPLDTRWPALRAATTRQ